MKRYAVVWLMLTGVCLGHLSLAVAGDGDEELKDLGNAVTESGDVGANASKRVADEVVTEKQVVRVKENLDKPKGRPFKPFESLRYAYVVKDENTLSTDMSKAAKKDETSRNIFIQLEQQETDTAALFPLRAKGNLANTGGKGGGGDAKDPVVHHWEAKAKVSMEEGGVIVSFFADRIKVPARPKNLVASLYPKAPAGFNPSDEQLLFDMILSVKGGLANDLKGVAEKLIALFFPGATVEGTPDFTNSPPGGLTGEEREYLTLLMLTHSPNTVPPNSLKKDFTYDPGDHRLLNELRFKYTTDGTIFDTLDVEATRLEVGHTPFVFPKGTKIRATIVRPGKPSIEIMITIDDAKASVTNNHIVKPPTGQTGGKGEKFVENALYVRAGPTLRPYEDFLLNFAAPPFFSELHFDVSGNKAVANNVVGHSPTHTWPSHFIYDWDDKNELYVLKDKAWQTGNRGPFPGFISVKAQAGDPDAGPQPSSTHKQSPNYTE